MKESRKESDRNNKWTTMTVRRSFLQKLREIYKAYGGNDRFGNFASFLDLMVDVFLLVDPEVVLQVLHQKQFGQSKEFRESLERLRRKHTSYVSGIDQISPSVPDVGVEPRSSDNSGDRDLVPSTEDTVEEPIEIEISDEHIL